MKRLLPILSIAVVMAACNSNPEKIATAYPAATQQAPVNSIDTAGFAAFQNYKAINELGAVQEPEQQEMIVAAPVKKATPAPVRKASKSVVSKPKPTPASTGNTSGNSGSSGSSVSTGNDDGAVSAGSGDVAQAPAERAKISKAAKGAVIGGVAGAAAGAVLNKKNRAVGAVIGGVIGAGGGYVLGRGMDKKDGRYLTTPTFNK